MKTLLKKQAWLLRRETWEHSGFWITPLVVGSILLLMTIMGAAAMVSVNDMNMLGNAFDLKMLDSDDRSVMLFFHAWSQFMPFAIALIIMLMFYCLDALYGDRRDRSIMFWKSLPLSDSETVLSKLFTAVFVAPLITLVFFIALNLLSLLIMSIGGAAVGINNWFWLTSPGQLLLAWLSIANMLLVCSILLLPVYSWFLLASAWARKAAFLWAIAPPLLVMWLEWMIFDTGYFAQMVLNRFAALFNFGLTGNENININSVGDIGQMQESIDIVWFWQLLVMPMFWGGAAVAALFIIGAIWLRRWRNED